MYNISLIKENYKKEPIRVKHSDLKDFSEDSYYKKCCPSCKNGVLLVKRDQETLKLLEEDFCVSCGRRVIYTDIDEMRKLEGGTI